MDTSVDKKIFLLLVFVLSPLIKELTLPIANINHIEIYLQFGAFLYFAYLSDFKFNISVSKNRSLIFLMLFSLLSSLNSSIMLTSLKRWLLVYINVILVKVLVANISEDVEGLQRKILDYLANVFVSISLFAILFQFFISLNGQYVVENKNIISQYVTIFNLDFYQPIVGRRPSSIFINPNSYGLFLYISMIFLVFKISDKRIDLKSGLLLLFLQTSGLISTQSRASILSFFVGVLIFILLSSNIIKKIKISEYKLLLLLPILFISVLIVGSLRLGRGSSGRFGMWKIAVNSIEKKPILGLGFGVSSEILMPGNSLSLHNSYLKIATEIGIIGLVAFIAYIFKQIEKQVRSIVLKDKENIVYRSLILSLLFSIMLHQMFEAMLLTSSYLNYFFVLILSIGSLSKEGEENEDIGDNIYLPS